jgi:hypothetical protein
MSLTRAEWQEMWKTIERLEDCVLEGIPEHPVLESSSLRPTLHAGYRKMAKLQIRKLKGQVQQVIGQMESGNRLQRR